MAHGGILSGMPHVFRKYELTDFTHKIWPSESGYITPACPPGLYGQSRGVCPLQIAKGKYPRRSLRACLAQFITLTVRALHAFDYLALTLTVSSGGHHDRDLPSVAGTVCNPSTVQRGLRAICLGTHRPRDNAWLCRASTDNVLSLAK